MEVLFMKKLAIFLLVIALCSPKAVYADPITNCIEQSDIKGLSFLVDSNFHTFNSDAKKRYINLAQHQVDKAQVNMKKYVGIRECARVFIGILSAGIAGTLAYGINQVMQDDDKLDEFGQLDWMCSFGGLVSSAYLAANQVYKLCTKYDRYRDYEKALAIKALLSEIAIEHLNYR